MIAEFLPLAARDAMWLAAPAAFLVAALALPLIIRACSRWKIFDPPGALKIHTKSVPRLGGAAVAAGLAAGAALAAAVAPGWGHALPISPFFFVALLVVWLAGIADDLRGLSPASRFAAQLGAAAILWAGGWRLPWVGNSALNLALVIFLVIGFCNAFNFLDGADGLAAGVAALVAAAYLLALRGAMDPAGVAVAAALAAACAAFLLWNFPPAKIFLGDSGSTVIGFAIAFLALDLWRAAASSPGAASHPPPSQPAALALLLFPFCVALLPLLDAALAIARRLRRAGSPFRGDRRHFYDLLFGRGWSHRRVALLCYALTAALALIAWWGCRFGWQAALAGFAASVGGLGAWMIRWGALRTPVEKKDDLAAARAALHSAHYD